MMSFVWESNFSPGFEESPLFLFKMLLRYTHWVDPAMIERHLQNCSIRARQMWERSGHKWKCEVLRESRQMSAGSETYQSKPRLWVDFLRNPMAFSKSPEWFEHILRIYRFFLSCSRASKTPNNFVHTFAFDPVHSEGSSGIGCIT